MAGDLGPAKARPRNRPPTTRISVFRAAAYEIFAAPYGFGDGDRICGSLDRLVVPFQLVMSADNARQEPVGLCDRSEYQAAPVHFAPEVPGGRCASHGIFGTIFSHLGLLRGRARHDRTMCDVSLFPAVFAGRLDAFHSRAVHHAVAFAPSCSRSTRVRTSSTSPSPSSPSWNGPNEIRISRVTPSPRWPSTLRISRFLPSRMPSVSHTLEPCTRSSAASIGP